MWWRGTSMAFAPNRGARRLARHGALYVARAASVVASHRAIKGSVTAFDGCSLTVNDVSGDDFTVLIIPHTLAVTTLGGWQQGQVVNLEVDLMARYAARLMETR